MFNRQRARVIWLVLISLLLVGCSQADGHVKAITTAVVSYSDYYIEVRNLSTQVHEQFQAQDVDQTTFEYTINADIPDYTCFDLSKIPYTLPSFSFSLTSASGYQKESALALRQALETYALENESTVYQTIPVSFSVVAKDNEFAAILSSQSKLAIQQIVEGMIQSVLEQNGSYLTNYHMIQVSSAMPDLLADAFGDTAYSKKLSVTDVSASADGTYIVSFTFPDPEFVFNALADLYTASFNQPIYGDSVEANLLAGEISSIDLTNAPILSTSITVSLDLATGTCTLLDDGGLTSAISAAKAQAEEISSYVVNSAWLIKAEETPSSGKIFEGTSKGNSIVFKTKSSLGDYCYVRFYKISSDDVSEEGTLSLGVFIKGGKSASLHLPSGYYRVVCVVGEQWYGLEHLFGSDGITYNSDNAIKSENGYISTVTFG